MNTLAKDRDVVAAHATVSFALFVIGALIGLFQMSSPIPFGAGYEMVALAKNLADHGSFANPFYVLHTGFTAANPPLYPFFLAILMKIFRLPTLVLAMAATGNIVANALSASLLPRVSQLFYKDTWPGIVASLLWLASMQLTPAWDTGYTVAGLLLLCLFSTSLPGAEKRLAQVSLVGLIAGLLFLLNPSTLLISLPWIAYLLLHRKVSPKEVTTILVVLSLIIFAWMWRNDRRLGAFVVRTNLGMTLYASNNDCAESSLIADESHNCYQSGHPNTSLSEAQLLQTLGEVRYDRRRIVDTKRWIQAHPERFRTLTLERLREFWFPPLQNHPFNVCVIWAVTVLSIPGLILMMRRREPTVLFVLAVLLIYPLMYYVVVSDVRYRYPVLWLSLLPAGYFAANCYRSLKEHDG